ncbi:hypothetical protein FCOIX_6237 [Fusarium coicis]|nr:hypothetical protein FCOIX_6237 [Fusarium coicis]
MSQPPSQSQEATAEIIRAANFDGPDKFGPELVPKLNFFAIFDDNGHWDLQFEPPAGVKTMNVMTRSDVCPGAMVYFGTKDGIHKAFFTALFLSNAHHVFFKVANVSQLFRPVNPFSRTAYLRLLCR